MISAADGAPMLEFAGAVATLTLRRPLHHNRIDADDTDVMAGHLDAIERNAQARVLVVTGKGHRTFCSGYTLGQIEARLDRRFEDMLDRLEALPIPTVCALNGSAYGGGTDLAICCDMRIGVTGSRMFMPAARFGLHYYPGGLRRFTAQLGPAAAKEIFLTGLPLSADKMLRIGFLCELVEPANLAATVAQYVDALLQAEPAALASMKAHINRWGHGSVSDEEGRAAYESSLRAASTQARLAALR